MESIFIIFLLRNVNVNWFLTTDIAACDPDPCQNGGICTQRAPDTFMCRCPAGFTGTRCESKYCLFHLHIGQADEMGTSQVGGVKLKKVF